MQVTKLREAGYEEAALGFSLSYNSSIERTISILPRYAYGIPGESKFLESMVMWLDVSAPRYWWQEADTYRVGTTKQSESTMHTLTKKPVTVHDFELPVPEDFIYELNDAIAYYKRVEDKRNYLASIKNMLPEGFIQRRIWMMSYKTFQNIYNQRIGHRLPQWQYFCNTVLESLEHPEFILKGTDGNQT